MIKKAFIIIAALSLLVPCFAIAGSDPPPPTGFKVFPTLQGSTTSSVGMAWETHNSATAKIRISPNYNMSGYVTKNVSSSTKRHKVTVSGLSANTVYYYTVNSDGETSPKGSFVTALPKGTRTPFRFAVYGDSRTAPWYEDAISKYGDNDDHLPVCISMDSYSPDFLVHVGDFVFDGNNMDDIYNFFDVEKELLMNNPLVPTYGNHEFDGGSNTSDTKMDGYLIPMPGAPNFAYYSYNYGNVHIAVLNTGPGVFAGDDYSVLAQGSAQNNWLKADLAAAAADPDIDHLFVSMHASPYSAANFGDNTKLQNAIEATCKQYGVKAVFVGHEHDYQHMVKDGIHYILSGGAGSSMMDYFWKGDQDDTSANLIKYAEVLNYVIIDVNGPTVRVEARKVQGQGSSSSSVLETFYL